MLTYHQAFDIYHTAFRIIKILNAYPNFSFEKERLRIFDFLILFPHELKNIQIPVGAGSYKYRFKETRYNSLTNRQRVFIQLGKYFNSSLSCLISYEILDIPEVKNNRIKLATGKNFNEFIYSFGDNLSIDTEILKFLDEYFLKMNLTELKRRSGLMEYRYDISES